MVAPTRIVRATDKQLVALANSLHDILGVDHYYVYFAHNAHERYDSEIDKSDFDDRAVSISRLEVVFQSGNLRLVIARGRYAGADPQFDLTKFRTIRQSATFDEYWVAGNQQLDSKLAKSIARAFDKYLLRPTGDNTGDVDVVALLASHIEQLRELELDFHAKQIASEQAFQQRRAELDVEAEEKLQARRASLDEEKAKLDKLREELNDREPQHERRRLREDLTSELRSFLSQNEKDKKRTNDRSPHYFQVIIGGLLFSFSALLTFQAAMDNLASDVLWISAIKSALLGAAGVAFAWAGLSGLKKAVSREDEFRREIQRYGYDMDRASWIVETILQMSSLEAQQIPDAWLEAVCEGLFSSPEVQHSDERSLDALAALLDATAKARVGTNGFEFELDKRGLRTAAKQAH